ncbi:MAG TPA: HDOD domain-containing protein [Candidatus Binatia bacterium]|nr:HDOD domain-containing protein [Candidatus Binatia bacterium]
MQLAPSEPASNRLGRIFRDVAERCELPPMPAVAARAAALASDPEARVEDLTRVVSTDPALAARVLRISQSVRYVRRHAPRTLHEAVLAVGFQALRKVLIAASCREFYRPDDAVAERLWAHALTTALAADELALTAGEERGGESFIAGLLHDVGRLILHLSHPAAYAQLTRHDEATETALFGVTHAAIGGCLAERWGVERTIVEAVVFHHNPGASPLAARLATADGIAHAIGFGSVPGDAGYVHDAALLEIGARVAEAFEAERALFA